MTYCLMTLQRRWYRTPQALHDSGEELHDFSFYFPAITFSHNPQNAKKEIKRKM